MAEHPSPLVISEAKTSNRPSDSLRSPTYRTREHLLSQTSSSVLASVADDTSLSSTPDFQEEEGVQDLGTIDFFSAPPRSGKFLPLIEWLLRRGERGDVGALTASQKDSDEHTQASFFNEDYILKLCAAATTVLVEEPALLELEVIAHDTLVVVGDIHGQFQDLYTSVLCQQYDRRRCNPEGRDHRFLFMGDYVDRGPHSLEVMLLLLALKVEYPTLVYLTRGNHEEEKTSRVYGFLTEVTTSLGAAAGTAVWSAVNKVFLDLPLAAIVQTLYMRFFVTHGGLSPGLQSVEEIASIDRHNYSSGNVTAAEDDLITGLLWSDPTNEMAMYKQNPRGCGFLFGPSASNRFCADNNFDFICRAHQVAMDGYFWTHNDRVVTVFSAPNYCGVNGNKGAVLLIKGCSRRPIVHQYGSADKSEAAPSRKADFVYADMFT
ncbi:putative phosphoprotein phosphatase [Leishmania mexicana MHOM/GT/2001/U1103]|uniref:Phosphoprotein phosphatase n=1 Tax=Leishmania mexicana (strain MHOM/GT/2001/U1103) TaxID=929439 RepID=E9APH5_LEIMU|nr:putative phosphoprotein phosphatase [Leishmania mexicana MHOM/GT/2001/U1103]CBZ24839.1 putative phosphoprotein phosphatase [Leishmania mexicana MHOM/GT/2001/U1103]